MDRKSLNWFSASAFFKNRGLSFEPQTPIFVTFSTSSFIWLKNFLTKSKLQVLFQGPIYIELIFTFIYILNFAVFYEDFWNFLYFYIISYWILILIFSSWLQIFWGFFGRCVWSGVTYISGPKMSVSLSDRSKCCPHGLG